MSLHRVSVWPEVRESNNIIIICGLLHAQAIEEVQRAEAAAVHRLHYLTIAFDLVCRKGMLRLPAKIGSPSNLLNVIQSFHTDMKGGVQFDGSSSNGFSIRSGAWT